MLPTSSCTAPAYTMDTMVILAPHNNQDQIKIKENSKSTGVSAKHVENALRFHGSSLHYFPKSVQKKDQTCTTLAKSMQKEADNDGADVAGAPVVK